MKEIDSSWASLGTKDAETLSARKDFKTKVFDFTQTDLPKMADTHNPKESTCRDYSHMYWV